MWSVLFVVFGISATVTAFPAYGSLAGLSNAEIERIIPTLQIRAAPSPPGPQQNTDAVLVNDAAHPWKPLTSGDLRGPCPAMNTLASHGWISRTGVDTPTNIIEAVQNGLNMGNDLAIFVTYAAHLVDGNLLTDLLSIGGKTPATGVAPPAPATAAGFDTHGVFEGDASLSRGDYYFGDNHSFNQTLFNEFVAYSDEFGAGFYNQTVGIAYRYQRIQESIATNPEFSLVLPRFGTIWPETIFPYVFFVDGRVQNGQLSIAAARGFFQNNEMPTGFYRRNGTYDMAATVADVTTVYTANPVAAGQNNGINNFTAVPFPGLTFCDIYTEFVNVTVRSLYPNPQGALRTALNTNLGYFYSPLAGTCTQLFPYGQ